MSGLKGVMDDCKLVPHAESRALQSCFVINVKSELLMDAGGAELQPLPKKWAAESDRGRGSHTPG